MLKLLLLKPRKIAAVLILLCLSAFGLFGFQNCSSFKSGVSQISAYSGSSYCDASSDPTCGHLTAPICSFNGQTVASGASVTAYIASTVASGASCQSQTRTCTSGTLSGAYTYATCAPAVAASCLFNGLTIADGASATAYLTSSSAAGGSCQSQSRLCSNGVLSGSYSYASCSSTAAASCLFNGQTVAHGASVNAFSSSSVSAGSTCKSTIRTCLNGTLSGSGDYASCTVAANASCLFNGQTIASGATVTAYGASSVPVGQSCQAMTRSCVNGILSGSGSYASCTAAAPASCLVNGQTIGSGSSIALYLTTTADPGGTCVTENRICTDGTLSGSATASSCSVSDSKTFAPFTLVSGATLLAGELAIAMENDGTLVVYRRNANGTRILWTSQTAARSCGNGGCTAFFQADGNLVLQQSGSVYWNSQSNGFTGSQLILSETAPYISIRLNQKTVWSGGAGLKFFTALHTPEGGFNWGGTRAGGTVDYLQLFQENSGWSNALNNLDVLKFYTQTLDNLSDNELLNAFAFLKRHHIAVAIESGALLYDYSNPSCNIEGMASVPVLNATSQRVIALGGKLDIVSLDEPLNAYWTLKGIGVDCGMNANFTTLASSVHDTYNLYRGYFPSVIMGDIDGSDGPSIAAFFDAYRAIENIPLAFYHDDGVPEGADWQAKIGAEIAALKSRNVSFGMIIDPSADDFSDIAGVARGVGRYVLYHQLGLPEPDQYIVQSWETYPQHVLPEGPPTSLTFLLNYLHPAPSPAGFDTSTVLVYRYLAPNGDRFWTASQTEGSGAGFTLEGGAFNLFAAPSPARVGIYRCSSGG